MRSNAGSFMSNGYLYVFGGHINTIERHDMVIGHDFEIARIDNQKSIKA